jgi:hypothetical protein
MKKTTKQIHPAKAKRWLRMFHSGLSMAIITCREGVDYYDVEDGIRQELNRMAVKGK